MLATFCAWATTPLHVNTRKYFDEYVQSWTKGNTDSVIPYAPWVIPADIFFCFVFSMWLCSVYVLVNGFFWLCDEYLWLQRYKCPRTPAMLPDAKLIKTTIRKELFAHFITAPIIMIFVLGPLVRHINPESSRPDGIPHVRIMFLQFVVCLLVTQVAFYWGHRMLHTPWLYKNVHKQHHMYIATRSFAAGRALAAKTNLNLNPLVSFCDLIIDSAYCY